MYCRYFLVIFYFLPITLAYADTSVPVWDCQKSEDGQWTCITEPPKPAAQPEETPDSEAPQQLEVKKTLAPGPVEAEALAVPVPQKTVDVQISPSPKPEPGKGLPLRPVATKPGWTCVENPEDSTWDCQLLGRDPKGKARLMEPGDQLFSLLPPAFALDEEQVFFALQEQMPVDPWGQCTLALGSQPAFLSQPEKPQTPMNVSADYSEVFDKEITSFWGNIDLTWENQRIQADMATYDAISEVLDVQGHIYYRDEGLPLYSDTAQVKLASDQAVMRNAKFIVPTMPVRGTARVIYRDSETLSHYKDVAYTSCAPGNQDWVMHASRLKMNMQEGKGAVKHAWLEFKGVPVLYLPYLSFPIDDRRVSGLLAPNFGVTDRGGIDISVPYYWNIAPNYDATVWARYLTKRGGMFGSKFRYLTESSKGEVDFEILPYDSKLKKTRWQGAFKNFTQFTPRLRSNIDVNYVSDDQYFNDLGNSLNINTSRFLRSYGDINYNRPGVAFSTLVENYQSIDETLPSELKPYRRLPRVALNLNKALQVFDTPLNLDMINEYVFFQHDSRVQGQRLNVQPFVSLPVSTPWAFLTPRVSYQYTQYWLENQDPGKASTISRGLPILSLDSGMFFERAFSDLGIRHSIEPRLFYLYVPHTDQDDIPLFDTSANDFIFSQLFRENRFNGVDRVNDANQVTMALTTRLFDTTSGIERMNLSVGEIFYFSDRRVNLLPDVVDTRSYSNIIAEFNGQISRDWSFSSGLQWNPDLNQLDRGNAAIRYRNEANQIFNVGYRFRRDITGTITEINQSNISFLLPIYDNWSLVARWQYSWLDDLTLESFVGLEKESCCWRFRVLARRYVNSPDSEPDTTFFIQLELKGLASFGDRVENFLEQNLSGYRKPNK